MFVVFAVLALVGSGAFVHGKWRALTPPRAPLKNPRPDGFENVELKTNDGLTLRGWWSEGPLPAAVVLAHGHGENRSQLLPEALALRAEGFSVLSFDWRAHGESDGEVCGWGALETRDLSAALGFVKERVPLAKRGVLGFSRGAGVAIESAALDREVTAVVAIAPSASLRESLQRDFGRWAPLAAVLLRLQGADPDSFQPLARVCSISPRALLLMHGSADAVIPIETGRRFARAACQGSTWWEVPDGGHGDFDVRARAVEHFRSALQR